MMRTLLAVLLLVLCAVPAQAQVQSGNICGTTTECGSDASVLCLTDGASASYTYYVMPCNQQYTRIHLLVETDGDGGDYVYTIKFCGMGAGMTCQSFSPAITGTLTVGGTAEATIELNVPYKRFQIALTTNDALATFQVTCHP